ncbi:MULTISPECIES: hypothetical protein [unclassified Streptomyces]|uniref:hypothetical protein n=1 Tax=unclassified Streptomyces TaxID=2593676 RepID=UPI00035EA6A3|nr:MULTISPECIES: hypothetical protein [unclassified Streptomyces]MYX33437.1 hypothetical protein [Streptomyces sp. SID8377]
MSRTGGFLVLFHCLTCLVLVGLSVMCADHDAPLFGIVFAALALLPVRAIRCLFDEEAAEMQRAQIRPVQPQLGDLGGPMPRTAAKAAAVVARTECDRWWSSLGAEHDQDCPHAPRLTET